MILIVPRTVLPAVAWLRFAALALEPHLVWGGRVFRSFVLPLSSSVRCGVSTSLHLVLRLCVMAVPLHAIVQDSHPGEHESLLLSSMF